MRRLIVCMVFVLLISGMLFAGGGREKKDSGSSSSSSYPKTLHASMASEAIPSRYHLAGVLVLMFTLESEATASTVQRARSRYDRATIRIQNADDRHWSAGGFTVNRRGISIYGEGTDRVTVNASWDVSGPKAFDVSSAQWSETLTNRYSDPWN